MSNGCPRASEGYHLGVSQVVVNDISRYCINTTLKYLLFWFNKIYLDSKRISALLLLAIKLHHAGGDSTCSYAPNCLHHENHEFRH